MADPGPQQDPFEFLNDPMFQLQEQVALPDPVPDVGTPSPIEVAPIEEPAEVAPIEEPADDDDDPFAFLKSPEYQVDPGQFSVRGPRAMEYEQPSVRVERSALSDMSDEEAVNFLPPTIPENPTKAEVETLHPALNTPEYYTKRKEVARLYNKASSNEDRIAVLTEFTDVWMPEVLERATGKVGWKEKGLTGLATAATWLDNVTGRWVRALVRTSWEDRENELKGGSRVRTPGQWWDSFDENYRKSDGSFEDGEEVLKQLYKLTRSGALVPGTSLIGDAIVGTGGKAGDDRLKQYEEETKGVFGVLAEGASDLGYGIGGAFAQIMPGGSNWSQYMAARRESKEMGSVGGHQFTGLVGQILLDPLMVFKAPKIAQMGGVDMTKEAAKAIDDLLGAELAAYKEGLIASGKSGDELETALSSFTDQVRNVYGKETLEAANLINQFDIPNYHGIHAPRILSDLKDPRFTHVVDDILTKADVDLPGTRPVFRAADNIADDVASGIDDAVDLAPAAEEAAEVAAMQTYRAEAAWAEVVRESIRRQAIPTKIDISYKGVDAAKGTDVWAGAIKWEKPVAVGRQTAEQAFKKTRQVHWMDNRRTKIMLGLIRRYPYLEPIRRTAESIMWLEKAQPMAVRRPLGDMITSMESQIQGRIGSGLLKADDPKVMAQLDELRTMSRGTSQMRWDAIAPKELARHGVLHQGSFRNAEVFEMFRQRRATLSAEESAAFFDKIKNITDNAGKAGAETLKLALHFKELGRHDPATAAVIEKIAKVDRIDHLYGEAANGNLADLPPAVRQEMEALARESDMLDAWKQAALDAEELYKTEKISRKEAWNKVRSNLNVIRWMMKQQLSDILAREADLRTLKDMVPVQDQIRQLRIWREEFADLIENKIWTGDKTFEDAFDQLRGFMEAQTRGMDKFAADDAGSGLKMVFEKYRRDRIVPKGTPEEWAGVRESLREGMEGALGDKGMSDLFMEFNDMRARTWASWNRLPPDMANAWYAKTYAEPIPGISPVRGGVKVSEVAALKEAKGGRLLFSRREGVVHTVAYPPWRDELGKNEAKRIAQTGDIPDDMTLGQVQDVVTAQLDEADELLIAATRASEGERELLKWFETEVGTARFEMQEEGLLAAEDFAGGLGTKRELRVEGDPWVDKLLFTGIADSRSERLAQGTKEARWKFRGTDQAEKFWEAYEEVLQAAADAETKGAKADLAKANKVFTAAREALAEWPEAVRGVPEKIFDELEAAAALDWAAETMGAYGDALTRSLTPSDVRAALKNTVKWAAQENPALAARAAKLADGINDVVKKYGETYDATTKLKRAHAAALDRGAQRIGEMTFSPNSYEWRRAMDAADMKAGDDWTPAMRTAAGKRGRIILTALSEISKLDTGFMGDVGAYLKEWFDKDIPRDLARTRKGRAHAAFRELAGDIANVEKQDELIELAQKAYRQAGRKGEWWRLFTDRGAKRGRREREARGAAEGEWGYGDRSRFNDPGLSFVGADYRDGFSIKYLWGGDRRAAMIWSADRIDKYNLAKDPLEQQAIVAAIRAGNDPVGYGMASRFALDKKAFSKFKHTFFREDKQGDLLFSRREDGMAPLAYTQFTNDGKAIIGVFENVKGPEAFTAAMEELGHIFRRDLPAQDLAVTEKWVIRYLGKAAGTVGENGRLRWTEAAEEAFARSFVKWLKTGEMPKGFENQSALREAFNKAKRWITEIYYIITGRSTPTRIDEAGNVVRVDPTARKVKGPQIRGYFEGAPMEGVPKKAYKIRITPDLEATFHRLLDPDSLKGDFSPLVRDMDESMAAFRGSDGVTRAMAFMKFQAAARDLSAAAGRTEDEADQLVRNLMSKDVEVRERGMRDLDVVKRQAAGRHKAVPAIGEIKAPEFRNDQTLKDALKNDLVVKLGLNLVEADRIVDIGFTRAVDDVVDAKKVDDVEELVEVAPTPEPVVAPATIDEVADEFPDKFVVEIRGVEREVRINLKGSRELSGGAVDEGLLIKLTDTQGKAMKDPVSYAELKAGYKGIWEGQELIEPELLEARKAEVAEGAYILDEDYAPADATWMEGLSDEQIAETRAAAELGEQSFDATEKISTAKEFRGWAIHELRRAGVPEREAKKLVSGRGNELDEIKRDMTDDYDWASERSEYDNKQQWFLQFEDEILEKLEDAYAQGFVSKEGVTPVLLPVEDLRAAAAAPPPAAADEAVRAAEAPPVRPESITTEDDVIALLDYTLSRMPGMERAAVREAVFESGDVRRTLNQIQDTGNELKSWERPIAEKWEAAYDKSLTSLGKKMGLNEAIEPATLRAHEAVADDIVEALYKEHSEAAIDQAAARLSLDDAPPPAAVVPEVAAKPRLTPESIDKMSKKELVAEIKARPEQLGPVGRGNKADLAKRLKDSVGPRGARIVEAPKKKTRLDIQREEYPAILKRLASDYVEKHPALARKNVRLGDVRAFDATVAADAVRAFDELWTGPRGQLAELRKHTYELEAPSELRGNIVSLRDAARTLFKTAWPGDSTRVANAIQDLNMAIVKERQVAAKAIVRFEAKLGDAKAEIARKTMAPRRGAPDDILQDAADVAAMRPTMVSEDNILRAEGAKRWLDTQIADRQKFIRMEMSRARSDSRKLKRVVDGEEVQTPLGAFVDEAEAGLRAAPYEGGGEDALGRALGIMKAPIPETGPWAKIKHIFSDVTKDPEIAVKEISDYMNEALKGLPDTEKAIWDAAKQMGYDLRTPGELWEVILNAKKWARSYGDELTLRRETALEAYRNDNMTALFDGLDRSTQGKIERLLKNRKLYGVASDAPPKIKALAKSLGMVGTEELFIHAGRKGRVNIGETYTTKQIEDALDVAKALDDMLENQLEKMQDAGLFMTVDHSAAAEIDMLRVELRVARDVKERERLIKAITDKEKASTRKWTKEEFLTRSNIGSYVPHLKTTAARMKTMAMKRGGMPSSQESFFQKKRTRASSIDDLNEQRRVQQATNDLYHWAVNTESPAWLPDGPLAGKDPAQVRDAANSGRLEEAFSVDEWDGAVKWARREGTGSELYDFLETDFNVLIERYLKESNAQIADAIFNKDMDGMFPVGEEIAKLTSGLSAADANLRAKEFGYERMSKIDSIQAATGIPLPAELRVYEDVIHQRLLAGESPAAIVPWLREKGINVDTAHIASFKMPYKFAPQPVVEYLRWINKPDWAQGKWWMGWLDGFHSVAKSMATISSIAHVGMNASGNHVSIAQKLGPGIFNPANHLDAMNIFMKMDPEDLTKFEKAMGIKHEDAVVNIGKHSYTVGEWKKLFDDWGISEAPLSRAFLEEIGGQIGGRPKAQLAGSMIGAGIAGTAGGMIGGPIGAAALGFLGQYPGALLGEVMSRGLSSKAVAELGGAKFTALPTAAREGWKRVWFDEMTEFRKSIEIGTAKGAKQATRYFGERSVGLTAGAAVGSVFGPAGTVAGAIAGLTLPSYMRMMTGLNQAIESQARITLAVGELRAGKSISEAAKSVDDALRNYSHLTPVEKHVFRRMFFFYTWDAGNMRFQTHQLIKNPRQAAVFGHFMNGVFKGQFTPEEIQAMPAHLRWRIIMKTGPGMIWSVNGLPQQAYVEMLGRWAEGKPAGMLTRVRPDALLMFEFFSDKRSVYYGKGWDELTNVRSLKDASPFLKKLAGFPVKKDPETGEWVPSPARRPIFNKQGKITGWKDDYRAMHPERYYMMSKLPGWRILMEQLKLQQDTFTSRAIDYGDPTATATPFQRAMAFMVGSKPYSIDFEAQMDYYTWSYLEELQRQIKLQDKTFFVDIKRAVRRIPPNGGELRIPMDSTPMETVPLETTPIGTVPIE